MYTELFYAIIPTLFAYSLLFCYPYIQHLLLHYLFRSLFLLASHVLCAQPAGPKIALCFLCLSIYIFVCASALIMCAIIVLLPCDFTLVDFGNSVRWLLCVATMSSLAQSQGSNSSSETDPSSNTLIQSKTGQHNLHVEC